MTKQEIIIYIVGLMGVYCVLSFFSSMFLAIDNLGAINGRTANDEYDVAFYNEYNHKLPCDRDTMWSKIVYSKLFCPMR